MTEERARLIRAYAAGQLGWRDLQEAGVEDFVSVLAGLHELGLKYPIARMEGPNVAARLRGMALMKRLLDGQKP